MNSVSDAMRPSVAESEKSGARSPTLPPTVGPAGASVGVSGDVSTDSSSGAVEHAMATNASDSNRMPPERMRKSGFLVMAAVDSLLVSGR